MRKPEIRIDVAGLTTFSFGSGNPMWWGNLAFMVIEGTGFIFAVATYLYIYNHNQYWPLPSYPRSGMPGLMWSSLMLVLMLLSELPNIWLKKAAQKADEKTVKLGLVVMSLIAILAFVLRGFEFTTMNIRWDDNAYGSIVWFLLGVHTAHIVTDGAETIVMAVMAHIGPVDMRRFPEVEDNQDYWHFVVFFWIVVYLTIYWLPRWLEALP